MGGTNCETSLALLGQRRHLGICKIEEAPVQEPRDGEAILAVERFGFGANNLAYAKFGDMLGYWDFFPAADPGWGQIPVWGTLRVIAARNAGVEIGQRFYGLTPMASHLIVCPDRVEPNGFNDAMPARAHLPGDYNWYEMLEEPAAANDAVLVGWKPVFTAPYFLGLNHAEAPVDTVIVTSASSKTALGLAWMLRGMAVRPRIVGLTSGRGHVRVVTSGIFDEVLQYDDIRSLQERGRARLIDFAGSGDLRARVHRQLDDLLVESVLVGTTHRADLGGDVGDKGSAPKVFLGFEEFRRYADLWGVNVLRRKLQETWMAFAPDAHRLAELREAIGRTAITSAYEAVLAHGAAPGVNLVMRF